MFKGDSLLRRVRMRATGATIHKVNSYMGAYMGYLDLVKDSPKFEKKVKELEDILNGFLVTGILKKK